MVCAEEQKIVVTVNCNRNTILTEERIIHEAYFQKMIDQKGTSICEGVFDTTIRYGLPTLSCLQLKTSFLNERSFAGSYHKK